MYYAVYMYFELELEPLSCHYFLLRALAMLHKVLFKPTKDGDWKKLAKDVEKAAVRYLFWKLASIGTKSSDIFTSLKRKA